MADLTEVMGRSKKVRTAIFSTLYLDLVEGLKQPGLGTSSPAEEVSKGAGGRASTVREGRQRGACDWARGGEETGRAKPGPFSLCRKSPVLAATLRSFIHLSSQQAGTWSVTIFLSLAPCPSPLPAPLSLCSSSVLPPSDVA